MADDQNNDNQDPKKTSTDAAQEPQEIVAPNAEDVARRLQAIKEQAAPTPAEAAQVQITQAVEEGKRNDPNQRLRSISSRQIPSGAIVSPSGSVLSVPTQNQSARSQQKQARKQMASAYTAQISTPPVPSPINQQSPVQTPFRSRLRAIFARSKQPQQAPQATQAPSGGTVRRGGSFSALDQYTKTIQSPTVPQKKPVVKRSAVGPVGLAVGALAGIAGGAGKNLTQQPPSQNSQSSQEAKGAYEIQGEEKRSDQGYIEKHIETPQLPQARSRALHFFIWANEYPVLFQFNPLDEQSPQFQLFLTNHPEIPRDILELKQTWQQYWMQFPEGMKSEQEQRQHEQLAEAPPATAKPHSSESLLSLSALPLVGLQYARESTDPERKHQKGTLEVLKKWQKENPGVIVKHQLYVHNPDGSLAVNHKLFDQVPGLLAHEKSRTFAYKDPDHDPLIKHLHEIATADLEKEVKNQGLNISADKEKIAGIKNDILAKKYDKFVEDSPHLAQAYKNHPRVQKALERKVPTPAQISTASPMATRSRFFDRLRQPLTEPRIRYARGSKNTPRRNQLPRRQPGGGLFSTSLLKSRSGPVKTFTPMRFAAILPILLVVGFSTFLLIFDFDPVQDKQSTADEGAQIDQSCLDAQGNPVEKCDPVDNPSEDDSALAPQKTPFLLSFFSSKAYAQVTGNTAPLPGQDISYLITVTYGKESKDIVVRNAIPDNAIFIRADPGYTRVETDGGRVLYVEWSLKKLQNPTLSNAELAAKTLPAIATGYKIKLTLRPRPGIKNTHIINQAEAVVDPIAIGSGNDTSGSTDTGSPNTPPNVNTCQGSITINNPDGTNFGDPDCTFTADKLAAMLKTQDPENADYWFSTVIPCESPGYDPNLYYRSGTAGDTPDAAGAWGLFQMGRGLNGQYDHGDVAWPQQITNAVTYRRNVSWRYWACAESRW